MIVAFDRLHGGAEGAFEARMASSENKFMIYLHNIITLVKNAIFLLGVAADDPRKDCTLGLLWTANAFAAVNMLFTIHQVLSNAPIPPAWQIFPPKVVGGAPRVQWPEQLLARFGITAADPAYPVLRDAYIRIRQSRDKYIMHADEDEGYELVALYRENIPAVPLTARPFQVFSRLKDISPDVLLHVFFFACLTALHLDNQPAPLLPVPARLAFPGAAFLDVPRWLVVDRVHAGAGPAPVAGGKFVVYDSPKHVRLAVAAGLDCRLQTCAAAISDLMFSLEEAGVVAGEYGYPEELQKYAVEMLIASTYRSVVPGTLLNAKSHVYRRFFNFAAVGLTHAVDTGPAPNALCKKIGDVYAHMDDSVWSMLVAQPAIPTLAAAPGAKRPLYVTHSLRSRSQSLNCPRLTLPDLRALLLDVTTMRAAIAEWWPRDVISLGALPAVIGPAAAFSAPHDYWSDTSVNVSTPGSYAYKWLTAVRATYPTKGAGPGGLLTNKVSGPLWL